MCETYWLVDNTKKKEYDKLVTFWENKLYPQTKALLETFVANNKGTLITDALLPELLQGDVMGAMECCPISHFSYIYCIGMRHLNGTFSWDGYQDLTKLPEDVHDFTTLELFLKRHPNYVIIDDNDDFVTLEEFKQMLQ